MSNFDNNRKTKEYKKERRRTGRDTLGKFFFDLAKLTFAAMVIAGGASFVLGEHTTENLILLAMGIVTTYIMAAIGYNIIINNR